MSKSSKNLSSSDDFSKRLEREHDRIVRGESLEASDALDPAVLRAIPVLDLLEEVRRIEVESDADETLRTDSETGIRQGEVTGAIRQPSNLTKTLERLKPGDSDGTVRLGKFLIHETLGTGGFGIVFRAIDENLGREVAIKVPRFEASLSRDSYLRFQTEAKSAAAIQHPNVVGLLEAGCERGIEFIAYEYVAGNDLQHLINQDGPLSPNEAVKLLVQLASGLQQAHTRGILHRDLKPANVLVDQKTQEARISDFGLAAFTEAAGGVTQTGDALGTPAYMSPEQAAGKTQEITALTDIYGLGAILYFALSGHAPFEKNSAIATIRSVEKEEPSSFEKLGRKVPRDLQAICLKCLEKDPAARYSSADSLREDLDRFVKGHPVIARPVKRGQRVYRWCKRNPQIAIPIAAAFFFLVTALLATTVGYFQTKEALRLQVKAELQAKQDFEELQRAVDTYFVEIESDPELQNSPDSQALRKRLLSYALGHYVSTLSRSERSLASPEELAEVELRIGRILVETGRNQEALTHFLAAAQYLNNAEQSDSEKNDSEKGDAELAAKVQYQIGYAQNELGQFDDAEQSLENAIELFQLSFDEPRSDESLALAKAYRVLGRANEERRDYEAAIQHGELAVDHLRKALIEDTFETESSRIRARISLLFALGQLANSYGSTGNLKDAKTSHLLIQEEASELLSENPKQWSAAELVAISAIQLFPILMQERKPGEAQKYLLQALPVSQRLCELHPSVARYHASEAELSMRLGICFDLGGDKEEAGKSFLAAVNCFKRQAERKDPSYDEQLRYVGSIINLLTFRHRNQIQVGDEEKLLEVCFDSCEAISDPKNRDVGAGLALAQTFQCEAWLHETNEELDLALDSLNEAIAIVGLLEEDAGDNPQFLRAKLSLEQHLSKLLK